MEKLEWQISVVWETEIVNLIDVSVAVIVRETKEVFWGCDQHGERPHKEDRSHFMVRYFMTMTVTLEEAHLLGNPLFLTNVKKMEVSSLHGHLNLCNSKGKNPGQQP